MRTSVTIVARPTHKIPKAKGAQGRMHDHLVSIVFTVKNPMDMKTGLTVKAERLADDATDVLQASGLILNAIPGIHPTIESYAAYLKERMLAKYPTVEVTISDSMYSVNTE